MLKKNLKAKLSLLFIVLFVAILFHHQSREINYSKLEGFLKQEDWLNADIETSKIINKILLVAVDKKHFWGYSRFDLFGQERLNVLLNNSSCQEFSKLNHLWQLHSNNKYGLSTQSKTLISMIKNNDMDSIIDGNYQEKFYAKVGWNYYWNFEDINWYESAKNNIKETGSLPSRYWLLQNSPKSLGSNGIIIFLHKFYLCESAM
jgi:hypothetical protein